MKKLTLIIICSICFFFVLVEASICPSNIGICNQNIPFQSAKITETKSSSSNPFNQNLNTFDIVRFYLGYFDAFASFGDIIIVGRNIFQSSYAYDNAGISFSVGDVPAGFFIESDGDRTQILEMAINSHHFNDRNFDYPGAVSHLDARGEFGRFHVYTYDADGTEHTPFTIGEDNEVYMTTIHADKSYISVSDPEAEILSVSNWNRQRILDTAVPYEKKGLQIWFNGTAKIEWNTLTGDYYVNGDWSRPAGNIKSLGTIKKGYYLNYTSLTYYKKRYDSIKNKTDIIETEMSNAIIKK